MKKMHLIGIMAACAVMLSACAASDNTEEITVTESEMICETVTVTEEAAAEEKASGTITVTEEITAETETTSDTSSETNAEAVTEETVFTDDFDKYMETELEEHQSLLITDLNGDGRRERVFCHNPFGYSEITYYDSADEKQTAEFYVMSAWGGTWYLEETKQIVNLSYFGHTFGTGSGFELNIYDFGGKDITLLKSYTAAGGQQTDEYDIPMDMTYFVDNEELPHDDAVSQLTDISEEFEKAFGYPLFVYNAANPDNYIVNYELITDYPTNLNQPL